MGKPELLITTIKYIVYWGSAGHKIIAEGNYYGLTWSNDRIYASRNLPDRSMSVIEIFDKSFNLLYSLSSKLLDNVHQIFWFNDELFITNTRENKIEIFNTKEFQYSGFINWTDREGEDKHHFNSIWINQEYFYSCESGRIAGASEFENFMPVVQILGYSDYYNQERINLPEAMQIHNIYVENNILYSCERYGLLVKDLSGRLETAILRIYTDEENIFLRGFARTENYFFIGESQELPRRRRHFSSARILILDNSLELVDIINLDNIGQIQDIRIVNGDLAHNGVDLS